MFIRNSWKVNHVCIARAYYNKLMNLKGKIAKRQTLCEESTTAPVSLAGLWFAVSTYSFSDMGRPCILSTMEDQELSLQLSCPRESLLSGPQGMGNWPVSFQIQILDMNFKSNILLETILLRTTSGRI